MVIPGPGPVPPPVFRGRVQKIEVVKSVPVALDFPEGESLPVSLVLQEGESLPVSQEPYLGAFTAEKLATYRTNGTGSDWGDPITFLQPAGNANYYPISILTINPCPVSVRVRLVLKSYSDIVLLMEMEESIEISPSSKGLFHFAIPYLLTVSAGTVYHTYTMYFQAAEPFEIPEGAYLQAPLLLLTSHQEEK